MKYANLHLHSTYSDAQFTPAQLVLIGKSLGYKALALTDHETDGGCKDFIAHAKAEGILALSGAEFYGRVSGVSIHLTALDFDTDNAALRAFIKERCDLRYAHTKWCFERGRKLSFITDITWNDVLDINREGAWLCIDSVVNTMKIKKAVPEGYDWAAFRKAVFNSPEAKALKPKSPPAKDVIDAVRGAGGIIGIAHPENKMHVVRELIGYGLNGIEVSHPDISAKTRRLAKEAASTHNLYRLGGTDHTGAMSGCGGEYAIPALHGVTEEEFEVITKRRLG